MVKEFNNLALKPTNLLYFWVIRKGIIFDDGYTINPNMKNLVFFPAVCMKNAEMKFNFGETEFAHQPEVVFNIFSKI